MSKRKGTAMDKLKELKEYRSQIKIKKALFGGYDKSDVLQKMEKMMELAAKCADAYEAEESALIKVYEKRMEEKDEKIAKLTEQVADLTREQEETLKKAAAEKEKMKAAYKECCNAILTEYSQSIRSLSSEFTHVMENMAKLQKGLKENTIFEQLEVNDER